MIRKIFRGRQQKLAMLCYVAWSKVKLSVGQTDKIDRIRRANAQRQVISTQINSRSQKFRKNQNPQKSVKSMPCVYYNDNSCNINKNHETKGVFYRHICSSCFAQNGKVSAHCALDCKHKKAKKKTNNPGHSQHSSVSLIMSRIKSLVKKFLVICLVDMYITPLLSKVLL